MSNDDYEVSTARESFEIDDVIKREENESLSNPRWRGNEMRQAETKLLMDRPELTTLHVCEQ